MKLRAEGIDTAEGKQKIVVELYDKFFRNAFPKMSERLGIVYTPVEIVDFILKSVDHLLRTEFGQTLGSEGVHIIDPFTGTGTFITRLLQSGLISPEELARKYAKEIHANEIVLLAYYIAAINIEAAYHGIVGGEYQPFEGICLTDTFQLYEKDDLISRLLVDNSARRTRQKKLDIRVIIGNPPYSVGQGSAERQQPERRVSASRCAASATRTPRTQAAVLKNALYDSYMRAIRWASDRVEEAASSASSRTRTSSRQCRRWASKVPGRGVQQPLRVSSARQPAHLGRSARRREGGKVFGRAVAPRSQSHFWSRTRSE